MNRLLVRLMGMLIVGGLWPLMAVAADRPGRFDFYLLALTWSPSYCAAEGGEREDAQCDSGRRYGFLVHGLWPQFERGYPEDCPTSAMPEAADIRAISDLMPSADLVRHEWRRHGGCSGLSPKAYLQAVRTARAAVTVPAAFRQIDSYVMVAPAEVEAAFMTANPGLRSSAIAVTCDGRHLREVRICLTRDFGFRACEDVDRRACRADKVVLPPLR